jgi:hypothetical protein
MKGVNELFNFFFKYFAKTIKSMSRTMGFLETEDDSQNTRWDYVI